MGRKKGEEKKQHGKIEGKWGKNGKWNASTICFLLRLSGSRLKKVGRGAEPVTRGAFSGPFETFSVPFKNTTTAWRIGTRESWWGIKNYIISSILKILLGSNECRATVIEINERNYKYLLKKTDLNIKRH